MVLRILHWLSRCVLAGIFLYTGYIKIRSPLQFAAVLSGYQLFPDSLILPLADYFPWVEIALASPAAGRLEDPLFCHCRLRAPRGLPHGADYHLSPRHRRQLRLFQLRGPDLTSDPRPRHAHSPAGALPRPESGSQVGVRPRPDENCVIRVRSRARSFAPGGGVLALGADPSALALDQVESASTSALRMRAANAAMACSSGPSTRTRALASVPE